MKNSRRKEHKAVSDQPQPKTDVVVDNRNNGFLKLNWDILAVLLVVAAIYLTLPLGTAVRFGGDEGYELMKGFLVSKGFKLYQQIWCDETPLMPMLLNWAFRLWGPSLLVARLMAAGFGMILFGTFFLLVRQAAGRGAAFFATFLLIASPIMLELSVSVMQEVPAFAVGLVSVLLLFRWRRGRRWPWLIASGILMGIALGIKVTAALLVPAVLAEIILVRDVAGTARPQDAVASVFGWLIAMGTSLGIILLFWGSGSFLSMWQTQSFVHAAPGMERPGDFSLSLPLLISHSECIVASIIGCGLVVSLRRWRDFLFPIVLLFTTFSVHLIHRPFWDYYYLHIAIAVAWLAGFSTWEFLLQILHWKSSRLIFGSSANGLFKALACIILTAFILVRSERRLEAQIMNLRQRERTGDSKLLAEIKRPAPKTHWIYTQEGMEQYAFEAGLPMPPEIAVVSLKRFWSGQISTPEIVEICRRYKPEELLLPLSVVNGPWKPFLKDYTLFYERDSYRLYVWSQLQTNSK